VKEAAARSGRGSFIRLSRSPWKGGSSSRGVEKGRILSLEKDHAWAVKRRGSKRRKNRTIILLQRCHTRWKRLIRREGKRQGKRREIREGIDKKMGEGSDRSQGISEEKPLPKSCQKNLISTYPIISGGEGTAKVRNRAIKFKNPLCITPGNETSTFQFGGGGLR